MCARQMGAAGVVYVNFGKAQHNAVVSASVKSKLKLSKQT